MGRLLSRGSPLIAVLFALGFANTALAADSYSFDTDHSHVMFTYNHLGLSTQHARFTGYEGTVVFDQEDITKSSIDVTIDATSVHTISTYLDDDLKSDNFFDVANYPTITFKSTSVQ